MRCDCHVHLVGAPDLYPQVPTRTYLAGVARLEDLERNAGARGISRFVLVQISVYGTDNSLLLEGLDALGDRGRGVVAVAPCAADLSALRGYRSRGVRGARLNLYSTASVRAAGGS